MRVKRKQVIHNVHILDASGSMAGGKYNSALEGINAEQEELKKDEDTRYTQTVIEFSSGNQGNAQLTEHCFMRPIRLCETVKGIGANGGTPLYETVGVTLEKLLLGMEQGDKVLVKIFTDGEENSSKGIYKVGAKLKELIAECESKGFTVTFVGTEGDVFNMVRNIGLAASNTYAHMNTPESIRVSYMAMADSTALYSQRVSRGQSVNKGFFREED